MLAAFVVLVAGMRAASVVLVPFMLAIFIGVILTPVFLTLRRRGIPTWVSLVLLAVGLFFLGLLGARVVGSSLTSFSEKLPEYKNLLQNEKRAFIERLESWSVTIPGPALDGGEPSRQAILQIPTDEIDRALDPQQIVRYAGNLATTVSGILGQGFIIILIVIFIMFEVAVLPTKVRRLPGMTEEGFGQITRMVEEIRHYMGIKTLMSLLTGALVTAWLYAMKVDYPLLLGTLAFLLNYVPNIGSILAAIPGVLLALLGLGAGHASIVALGYVIINVGVSNLIEPRYLGRSLGLSPLIILISLIFWGWVLGPMGMLLSVPLTMIAKIGLENSKETRWISLLMGPAPKDAESEAQSSAETKTPEPRADGVTVG